MNYAELSVTSNFTFLTGASHPEEYIERAAALGLGALAITDTNSFAGIVRAHVAAKNMAEKGTPLQFIVGVRLRFIEGYELLAYPTDRAAYSRLSQLLTMGKRRAKKGQCTLHAKDLAAYGAGCIFIIDPDHAPPPAQLAQWQSQWESQWESLGTSQEPPQEKARLFWGLSPHYDGQDAHRFAQQAALAHSMDLPLVATGNVLMHRAHRRALADILSCLREKLTIDQLGFHALPNAERRLRSHFEMRRLYKDYPDALTQAAQIAAACCFSLDELRYEYPDEVTNGTDPMVRLRELTDMGLNERYPDGPPIRVQAMVAKEMTLIEKMQYAPFFLTVHDVVKYARQQKILCQGRGSAANSVVCYALGITEVSPDVIPMVFERFVSEARDEPPDIDVDFEHERREEVIQHIYQKYGRDRAGLCATVIHFRTRAAIREVGKAMGLSQDAIAAMSSQIWGWSNGGLKEDRVAAAGLNIHDRRVHLTLKLANELVGFPRHLSQHVGGFVITKGRLDALCPIENAAMADRTVIEWDKDDIDALGILKVDVLALGMLSALAKSFRLLEEWKGEKYSLATLPPEDPAVYDMLCEGRTIGLFQVESRAQMNFLPRMRPRAFRDLIIEVAIVRPGPIQGNMVHPYLKRRRGEEEVTYPSKELEAVLERTLGVPLFQEQVMQVAVVAAGFTPSEADQLRRSVGTFRGAGHVHHFRDRFIEGALERGYTAAFADQCFSMLEGFSGYGFPESHAASFALLVYASAWLKHHHPEVFTCALLNSLPMGFYAPAQIIQDARRFGVEVRPLCINHSYWDHTLEPDGKGALALRLGFRLIKGFRQEDADWVSAARARGYRGINDVWLRAGIGPAPLARLAEADAFAAFGLNRRQALWEAKAIRTPRPLPLFADLAQTDAPPPAALPALTVAENVFEDYLSTRLTLGTHPLALLTAAIEKGTPPLLKAQAQRDAPDGRWVHVAGLVTTRQRPGTASGVIFLTLEDETGHVNAIVWPKIFEKYRRTVMMGRLLAIKGKLQREGVVTHIIASQIDDRSDLLDQLGDTQAAGALIDPSIDNADEAKRPVPEVRAPSRHAQRPLPAPAQHPREQAKRLFRSRDFR